MIDFDLCLGSAASVARGVDGLEWNNDMCEI
jgi:hypothetical protein